MLLPKKTINQYLHLNEYYNSDSIHNIADYFDKWIGLEPQYLKKHHGWKPTKKDIGELINFRVMERVDYLSKMTHDKFQGANYEGYAVFGMLFPKVTNRTVVEQIKKLYGGK